MILINELDLEIEMENKIEVLLKESFDEYAEIDRSYYKQRPNFRIVEKRGEDLIGYMGIDYRVMKFNDIPVKVLGIIDLCVDRNFRSKNIASQMLEELDEMAKEKKIDFLLLLADNPSIYLKNGYKKCPVNCTWQMIDDHKSYGIKTEKVDEIMIKSVFGKIQNIKNIDMLGYMY